MEFINIGKSNIKISLTAEEVLAYELDISDDCGSCRGGAGRALRRIFESIKEQTGIDYSGDRVYVRMFRSKCGGRELFVTRLGAGRQGAEDGERKDTESDSTVAASPQIYSFDGISPLLSACKAIRTLQNAGESAAYITDIGGSRRAFLLLYSDLPHVDALLCEYGKKESFTGAKEFVLEHCDVLAESGAIAYLAEFAV